MPPPGEEDEFDETLDDSLRDPSAPSQRVRIGLHRQGGEWSEQEDAREELSSSAEDDDGGDIGSMTSKPGTNCSSSGSAGKMEYRGGSIDDVSSTLARRSMGSPAPLSDGGRSAEAAFVHTPVGGVPARAGGGGFEKKKGFFRSEDRTPGSSPAIHESGRRPWEQEETANFVRSPIFRANSNKERRGKAKESSGLVAAIPVAETESDDIFEQLIAERRGKRAAVKAQEEAARGEQKRGPGGFIEVTIADLPEQPLRFGPAGVKVSDKMLGEMAKRQEAEARPPPGLAGADLGSWEGDQASTVSYAGSESD